MARVTMHVMYQTVIMTISNASLCRKGDIGRILIHEPFVHLLKMFTKYIHE